MLCTLASMTAGSASVAGYDVVTEGDQVRLSIGVALQDAALDGKLTGRETLLLQGRYYGLERGAITTRIEELAPCWRWTPSTGGCPPIRGHEAPLGPGCGADAQPRGAVSR